MKYPPSDSAAAKRCWWWMMQNERLLADEEMLAALGYEPIGFTRAHDALAACRAIPKRFDALLVRHIAPAGSALDLAAALHESVPDVPVLLTAAWADEIGVDSLVAAGISEVVHRPLISGSWHRHWRVA
jgi:DNA-binding NtrC family response regulator